MADVKERMGCRSYRLGSKHHEIIEAWRDKFAPGSIKPDVSAVVRRIIEMTEPMLEWDLEDVERFAETGECP